MRRVLASLRHNAQNFPLLPRLPVGHACSQVLCAVGILHTSRSAQNAGVGGQGKISPWRAFTRERASSPSNALGQPVC